LSLVTLGGVPSSFNHSYAVYTHVLKTVRWLLMVFFASPFLNACVLYFSISFVVIRSIRILPKKGMSEAFKMYFFEHCSDGLLLATEYSANHFHANCANVCSCTFACAPASMLSPRANFCRKTASYASAPALEFSGLRFRYRIWLNLKSTHHDFLLILTAIYFICRWIPPVPDPRTTRGRF